MNDYLAPYKVAQAASDRNRPSRGVTLVAGFGAKKPRGFTEATRFVRATFEPWLPHLPPLSWRPYFQLHMTLIGLEAQRRDSSGQMEFVSTNLADYRGDSDRSSTPAMDLKRLLEVLRSFSWPMVVSIGGFPPEITNPCDLDYTPYERSCFIRPGGKVVTIALPPDLARSVETLRQQCRDAAVLHKYHGGPELIDNDMFAVVGDFVLLPEVDRNRDWSEFHDAQDRCREDLMQNFGSAPAPFEFTISEDDCEFVSYELTTLARVTKRLPLSEATPAKLHEMLLAAT